MSVAADLEQVVTAFSIKKGLTFETSPSLAIKYFGTTVVLTGDAQNLSIYSCVLPPLLPPTKALFKTSAFKVGFNP